MKHCDLSVGDWIIIENCYAYILAVHDIFMKHSIQKCKKK